MHSILYKEMSQLHSQISLAFYLQVIACCGVGSIPENTRLFLLECTTLFPKALASCTDICIIIILFISIFLFIQFSSQGYKEINSSKQGGGNHTKVHLCKFKHMYIKIAKHQFNNKSKYKYINYTD